MNGTVRLACAWALIFVPGAASNAAWLDASHYGSVTVVRGPEAAVEKAVTEFVRLWALASGGSAAVAVAAEPEPDQARVWLGMEGAPGALTADIDAATLGEDGFHIRTSANPPSLLIAGSTPRGVLYGVYEFFERAFGVRFLAPEATHVPPAPGALPDLDLRVVPRFRHRLLNLPPGMDPDLWRIRRAFEPGLYGHSLFELLPPEEHFAAHPEWYSEIDGVRVAPVNGEWRDLRAMQAAPELQSQLCMSNPEVAQAIADALLRRIESKPDADVWSVCQMDWRANCTCAACRALDEREGGPMGSLLTGVNRVAEIVAKSKPGTLIHTYAYWYTRKPPKTIRPRENVVVELCAIECDFGRTLNDPAARENRAFLEDLKAWQALTPNLLLYNYPNNYRRYFRPHPNFHVLGPNMRLFAEHPILGVYEQTEPGDRAEFGYLRPYVLAKLLWNPEADADALRREFIDLYYRAAAPFIHEYIDLMERTLVLKGANLSCFDRGVWIDPEFVLRARDIFQRAFDAVKDTTAIQRLTREQLQVHFAALTCQPALQFSEGSLTLSRPPSISPDSFSALLRGMGISHIGENRGLDELVKELPPASQTVVVETLRNRHTTLLTVPALGGAVLLWRDTRTGLQLLRGFEAYGTAYPGVWQEWTHAPRREEGPAAPAWEVVEKQPMALTLRAEMSSGLILTRTTELARDDDRISVTLTLSNPTAAPLPANIKIRPEFNNHGEANPEFWAEDQGGWRRVSPTPELRDLIGGGSLAPTGLRRWAIYLPRADLSIINDFRAEELGELAWSYDARLSVRQVLLELIAPSKELGPGETRSMTAGYRAFRGRPTDAR